MNVKWKSENFSGCNHPQYNRIRINCSNCKKEVFITEFKNERNRHNFCSRACYSEFRGKYYVGDNSYWMGKKRPEISNSSRENMLRMLREGKKKK